MYICIYIYIFLSIDKYLSEIRSNFVTSKKTDETVQMMCKVNSIFDEILKTYT